MIHTPFPPSWERPRADSYKGNFATLTPLNADTDVPELYACSHLSPERERIWKYMTAGPFENQEAFHAYCASREGKEESIFFTVHSHALQRRIGQIALLNIVPEAGRAELGHIWYAPEAQKTKINTECVYLLLRHLFDDLGYRRAEWKCNNENAESKRAAERLGFRYEGLFRQHMVIRGENRDTAWFSLLDSEWQERRQNFERYLSGDNISLTELNRNGRITPEV
jgi:RimJ/RimL family protein N-acetyltransferase